MVRGERRHRRSDERSDIAGGAIEIYREGKSEQEEITASNKHRRDAFVSGDQQTSVFFMTFQNDASLYKNAVFGFNSCIVFINSNITK